MPTAIVATPGAANANSFVTEAECDTYLGNRLNASAWNGLGAGADTRLQALHESARMLNLMPWKGSRTDSTQALSAPREYWPDPDLPWAVVEASDSYYYDNDVIPQRLKDAQCELALEFLKAGTTDLAVAPSDSNVKKKKLDIIEKEFWHPDEQLKGLDKFPRIMDLLWDLLTEDSMTGIGYIRA